jgi:hypothetical protein
MPTASNPFDPAADPDRHYIWQRLIIVDSEAFAEGDWSRIEGDFDAEHFEGIRCFHSVNPDDWRVVFPHLASYRDSWLAAAAELARAEPPENRLQTILSRTRLDQIDISGERALAHKKFSHLHRQSLFRLHKRGRVWKIVGFLGQLPLE